MNNDDLITLKELSPGLRQLINSDEKVEAHNTNAEAHSDIREQINNCNDMIGNSVNRKNGEALGYSDGRQLTGDDLKPSYYFKNGRMNGLCLQLFDKTQLGEGIPNGLYHVITTCPWQDVTGIVHQVAYSRNGQFTRKDIEGQNAWQPWQQIATTTKTEYSLSLLSGFTADTYSQTKIVKDGCGNYTAYFGATKNGQDIPAGVYSIGSVVGNPSKWVQGHATAYIDDGTFYTAFCYINSDGIIMAHTSQLCKKIQGFVEWREDL